MTLLIVFLALCCFLGFGFIKARQLRNIHIQKEVSINGSLPAVYEQVQYLNNFPNWSPFLEADPDQIIEITGVDGTVGAQYHWEGNKGKDLGFQEIKAIVPNAYIKMACDIQKPFKAQPVFEYRFKQVGAEVKVTQDFHLESGTVDAFFMWVFRAKKNMANLNQRGLELLRTSVEGKTSGHLSEFVSTESALVY